MTGFQVSRTRLLLAACALVAVLIGVASASADRGPSPTLTFTSCGLTPQAARTECATADLPLDYGHPNGAEGAHRRRPRPRRRHPARRAVLQLRRAGRRGRRLPPVQRREHALACAQPALRHHRLRPARRRPEHAGDRLPGQPGDGRHLLAAVHDAVQPGRERAGREGAALHQGLPEGERRHPVARLDRQRRPRHGPDPRAARREQAELPRLLLRHVPRRDVREPVPERTTGRWCSTARSTRRRTSTSRGATWPSRRPASSVRSTASSRRAPATRPRARASAGAIRGTPTTSWSTRRTPIRSPRRTTPDPRPVDGDDINFAVANELYAKEFWGEIGEALAEAKAGDGSFIRDLVDGGYGRNDDGTLRQRPRPVLHDRSVGAALSARRATSTSTAGTRPGARSTTTT